MKVLRAVRRQVQKTWRRLGAGHRYRARRREAGLAATNLSTFECYSRALDAFDMALEGSASETELALIRFLLPLNASELIEVATAMAMLGRPLYMDSHNHADIERMKLHLTLLWTPEWER